VARGGTRGLESDPVFGPPRGDRRLDVGSGGGRGERPTGLAAGRGKLPGGGGGPRHAVVRQGDPAHRQDAGGSRGHGLHVRRRRVPPGGRALPGPVPPAPWGEGAHAIPPLPRGRGDHGPGARGPRRAKLVLLRQAGARGGGAKPRSSPGTGRPTSARSAPFGCGSPGRTSSGSDRFRSPCGTWRKGYTTSSPAGGGRRWRACAFPLRPGGSRR